MGVEVSNTLKKGKYALFTIPNKEEWTIIFNKTWDQWGAFNYEESQDALRVTVKPNTVEQSLEGLTISLEQTSATGVNMRMQWGKVQVVLPFEVPQPEA